MNSENNNKQNNINIVLWKCDKLDKLGNEYWKGVCNQDVQKGDKIIMFMERDKKSDKHPDFVLIKREPNYNKESVYKRDEDLPF